MRAPVCIWQQYTDGPYLVNAAPSTIPPSLSVAASGVEADGSSTARIQRQPSELASPQLHSHLKSPSAGAHLVSLLAADPRIVISKGGTAWFGTIVLDSAAYDLVEIMQRKHPRIYDRAFGKDPAFWTDASPYRRLTVAPAPMLLVCSTKRSDACPPTQMFATKATELGGKITVLPVDMKHGELNKELGLPSDYTTTIEGFMHTLGLP